VEEPAGLKIVRTPVRTKSDTPCGSEIAINVPSETNSDHFNDQFALDDPINDPIIAHAYPIAVLRPLNFSNSRWVRVLP
jgi:hypothetical protein